MSCGRLFLPHFLTVCAVPKQFAEIPIFPLASALREGIVRLRMISRNK
jgi:hypothetical protein